MKNIATGFTAGILLAVAVIVTSLFALVEMTLMDTDDDGQITAAGDLPLFVQVLLGIDTTPQDVYRADVNCDGNADGEDIQGFVDLIMP